VTAVTGLFLSFGANEKPRLEDRGIGRSESGARLRDK